jgi:hypothetical protein
MRAQLINNQVMRKTESSYLRVDCCEQCAWRRHEQSRLCAWLYYQAFLKSFLDAVSVAATSVVYTWQVLSLCEERTLERWIVEDFFFNATFQ